MSAPTLAEYEKQVGKYKRRAQAFSGEPMYAERASECAEVARLLATAVEALRFEVAETNGEEADVMIDAMIDGALAAAAERIGRDA